MSKPASCRLCGETWPRDPRLEVPCPTCRAAIGSPCKRPSEHTAPEPHLDREEAACAAGAMGRTCPAARPRKPKQRVLFEAHP